jgi:hypothetical protein
MYDKIETATTHFNYFKTRSDRVRRSFIALFEDFNPINLGFDGLTVNLDDTAHTFEVEMFGRRFIAELCLLTKDSDVVGYVEYSEMFEGKRRVVDAFQISSQSYVSDVSGKELIPVQDYSEKQNLFILNLIHLGLSKPIQRGTP